MLKVNFDSHNGDYLDYLLPFMRFVIATKLKQCVTPKETAALLAKEFGLSIPLHVCEKALKRLVNHDFLKKENHSYYVVKEIDTTGFGDRREAGQKVAETAGQKIVDSCKDLFGDEVTMESALKMFGAYLRTFSIECVRAYVERTDLPVLLESDHSRRGLYVVNRVIRELRTNDPKAFEAVITLVKGHMLANALACEDLESIKRKFGVVTFYLDTPLILRILELDDLSETQSTTELVQLLTKLDGKLAVFSHTFAEVEHVLTSIANGLNNHQSYRPIFKVLRERRVTPSDVLMLKSRLQSLLQEKGIMRIGTPPNDPQYQIDEAALEALIKEDIYYSTDGARHADVKSVQSIYTLRARAEPQSVEDCVAVMVTSNSNLVRTVHQFGKDKPSTERVAAMVTDFSLANIAWLKAPLGNPSLPEFEVMSACYAALEPTIPLWNKYLAEIERLRQLGRISADDHQLLRFESTAQLELMDMTQGSEGYLNGETISDVLDAVKAKLTAAKQVEVDAAKQTAQDVRKILVRQNALLRLKAETFAARTITVIRILLAIFFASVAVIGACYDLPDLSIFGTIFVLLGIAFSVFSAWNGQSIQTLTAGLLSFWIGPTQAI